MSRSYSKHEECENLEDVVDPVVLASDVLELETARRSVSSHSLENENRQHLRHDLSDDGCERDDVSIRVEGLRQGRRRGREIGEGEDRRLTSELSRRSRDTVGGRPVTSREDLSGNDEGRRVGSEVLWKEGINKM